MGNSGPLEYESVDALLEKMEQLRTVAPEEVRDDLDVMISGIDTTDTTVNDAVFHAKLEITAFVLDHCE